MVHATNSKKSRRALWISIGTGAGVFVVVFAAAIILAFLFPRGYRSSPELLVLPDPSLGRELESQYFDVLDQGPVVQNFAEILRTSEVKEAALDVAGIAETERSDIKIEIVVPTETSVLEAQVTAPDARTTEAVAEVTMDESVATLVEIETPFVFRRFGSAGDVTRTGLSGPVILAVGFLAAAILGLAAQQATVQLAWMLKAREQ